MSRTRKGLKAPSKKIKRRKVNPYHRQAGRQHVDDGYSYDPESEEGMAISAMMESIFGPFEGRTVYVASSENLHF